MSNKTLGNKAVKEPMDVRLRKYMAKIWRYKWFYFMLLPVLVTVVVFYYLPMLGIRFAFYKYTPFKAPEFAGFAQFEKLFANPSFWLSFKNTIQISLVNLALSMIVTVILALLMNEIKNIFAKRTVQTIVYLPHFLSWVVVASIFMIILSPQNGFVNNVLMQFGIIKEPIYYLADLKWWRFIYYFINRWKETGYGTVIFMATLAGISPELYEAANIDGAGRIKQALYITVPSIMNTFVIVLILNLSKVLNLFESVLVLYNSVVYSVADVLQTYVYRFAIIAASPDYGYTTAVGLFKSVIACILVLGCDFISKKVRGRGIL